MTGINIASILANVQGHAQKTGYFTNVLLHEPKNAPGPGLTCVVWADRIEPAKSSVTSVSANLVLKIRLYTNMLAEPEDAIDASLIMAADALYTEYCGDFDLGSEARYIDVFGSEGTRMDCLFGYIEQDKTLFRFAVITLPIIINDVWTEAA
jgi:hypothetical protein